MKRAVAGIVFFNNKILIGKKVIREGHFASGGWHLPGGHIEEGENEEEALLREFKEETQLEITIIKKLHSSIVEKIDTHISWFICSTNTDKAIAGDDLSHVNFIEKTNVITECDPRVVTLWPSEVIEYLSE